MSEMLSKKVEEVIELLIQIKNLFILLDCNFKKEFEAKLKNLKNAIDLYQEALRYTDDATKDEQNIFTSFGDFLQQVLPTNFTDWYASKTMPGITVSKSERAIIKPEDKYGRHKWLYYKTVETILVCFEFLTTLKQAEITSNITAKEIISGGAIYSNIRLGIIHNVIEYYKNKVIDSWKAISSSDNWHETKGIYIIEFIRDIFFNKNLKEAIEAKKYGGKDILEVLKKKRSDDRSVTSTMLTSIGNGMKVAGGFIATVGIKVGSAADSMAAAEGWTRYVGGFSKGVATTLEASGSGMQDVGKGAEKLSSIITDSIEGTRVAGFIESQESLEEPLAPVVTVAGATTVAVTVVATSSTTFTPAFSRMSTPTSDMPAPTVPTSSTTMSSASTSTVTPSAAVTAASQPPP